MKAITRHCDSDARDCRDGDNVYGVIRLLLHSAMTQQPRTIGVGNPGRMLVKHQTVCGSTCKLGAGVRSLAASDRHSSRVRRHAPGLTPTMRVKTLVR
jgi:hypothetical protein